MPNVSPSRPPAIFWLAGLQLHQGKAKRLTDVTQRLPQHEASLQHAEDGGATNRGDDLARDDVDDEADGTSVVGLYRIEIARL